MQWGAALPGRDPGPGDADNEQHLHGDEISEAEGFAQYRGCAFRAGFNVLSCRAHLLIRTTPVMTFVACNFREIAAASR